VEAFVVRGISERAGERRVTRFTAAFKAGATLAGEGCVKAVISGAGATLRLTVRFAGTFSEAGVMVLSAGTAALGAGGVDFWPATTGLATGLVFFGIGFYSQG
jgi:hypothetical protein